MSSVFEVAGAAREPSAFAPLHVNRMLTGLWTNTNPLRDAGSALFTEKFYGGKQDSIMAGANCEITPKQTLRRRPGLSVYNDQQDFPAINRFYSFNVFDLTTEAIHVLADTANTVYDVTPNSTQALFTKSAGAGSTYFQSVGNRVYFANGVDNMQWDHDTNFVGPWGITAPPSAPSVLQKTRPNNYAVWQPGTAFAVQSPALSGIVILDDLGVGESGVNVIPTQSGGQVAIMAGQNFPSGSSIALPTGFDTTRLLVWVTPAVGHDPSITTPGVYQATGNGGVVQASFQNRPSGFGFTATCSWIAIAWDEASGVTPYSSGNYSGINFRTETGDLMWLQIGWGYDQTTIYTPSGTDINNSLHMPAMISSDSVDHSMQGVYFCRMSGNEIQNLYDDGSANEWHGNTVVFSVFWEGGGNIYMQGVTNGTALIIPTTGVNSVCMVFANMHDTNAYGIPAGYTGSQFSSLAAMNGHDASPGNRGHGWSCLMKGQTLAASVSDGSGNTWYASANVFAVASINNATGGNIQFSNGTGVTGSSTPVWNTTVGGTTTDGSVTWTNRGPSHWQANHYYNIGDIVMGVVTTAPGTPNQVYVCVTPGNSGALEPHWVAGVNTQQQDGDATWQCVGQALSWNDLGAGTQLSAASTILDANGYLQTVFSPGVSGTQAPAWSIDQGVVTQDNTVLWQNAGPFAPQGTGPIQYVYTYQNSTNSDQSNASAASPAITMTKGNQAIIQGVGTGQAGVDEIQLWRTLQGGSSFLFLDTIPNPGEGQTWTYTDTKSDAELNVELQAPILGENTPLEKGATCLEYHMSRVWAAVGNVVWASSGPDATLSGSNGNTGFNTSFTMQSRVTRLWTCSVGLLVFTVRDCYAILGDGNTQAFYAQKWIENIPLLNYDAFAVNLTTAYVLTGQRQIMALDPGGGVIEISYPICNIIASQFPPASSSLSYHTGVNAEAALYVSDASTQWIRLSSLNAPDQGQAWNPPAYISGGMSAVQSVEISPGVRMLLVGPPPSGGPILIRDLNTHTDNGTIYQMTVFFGNINLASPGQLAGIAWLTMEGAAAGSMPQVSVLMQELSGTYEVIPRSRQDPPNLPPSETILANRHSLLQGQNPVWCRHMMLGLTWPNEDAPSELYAYTVFGQIWQEMRSAQ